RSLVTLVPKPGKNSAGKMHLWSPHCSLRSPRPISIKQIQHLEFLQMLSEQAENFKELLQVQLED
ncbi:Phosphoribosylformylglycinamidine synthase subunit PurL, partial [Clarias magur]